MNDQELLDYLGTAIWMESTTLRDSLKASSGGMSGVCFRMETIGRMKALLDVAEYVERRNQGEE